MSLLTPLNPYLTYIKIAGFVLALAAASGATYYVKDNIDTVKYQKLELAQSKSETANIAASLTQLQTFIGKMNAAATGYNADLAEINLKFDNLKKGLANALRTPLPPDCKPTADRVRSFHDALDAANAGAAARR